ncbi:MAG: 2-dehydro-3-deoxy-D-gluconate 5-dehydrogenase KduD [Pyrinomonadaceae bacterium]|nr:2-dehydro-3-deoxy-D-gluconate 5-dehydrogenase KduD [Pyrinomonadaceae bacterium]
MILDAFKLDGRTAIVTGSATGIGRSIAAALADAGATVACHCRKPGDASDTVAAITANGGSAYELSGDMADAATPDRIVGEVLARSARLDILVNNAGSIRRAPAARYTDEDWQAVIDVNLTSVFRLARAAGSHMIERGAGKIVNIASLLSFQGGITVPAYTASKSAVAGLTKALANEWASSGVNVNAIAPGYISTKNTEALRADETRNRQILERIPAGRWGEPDDIAGAALFLASDASRYVNGHILVVDGGWMGR